MRIATWNVERPTNATSPRSQRILQKIHHINAGIWILTETHDDITPGPAYTPVATEPVPTPPTRHKPGERRTILWSRYPILETIPEDVAHRTVCARLQTPLGPLVVFGAIIPYSGRDCPPYGQMRRWEAHYAAIAVQGACWLRLNRKYYDHALLVGGDFNQTREGRYTYGTKWGRTLLDLALKQVGLHDATIPSLAARDDIDGSGWTLPPGQQPIDHLCLSKDWFPRITAIGAWPGQDENGYLSDHSGVWIDLS